MIGLRNQIRMTMGLGALALLGGLIAHLALTDIYHGEESLAAEWNAVRVGALVVLSFIAVALLTLGRASRALRRVGG